MAKKISQERFYLYAELAKMGLDFVKTFTNFILIKLSLDSSSVSQKLLRKGVIVRDMKHWGLDRYIRVTIGTHSENQKFIQALKGII